MFHIFLGKNILEDMNFSVFSDVKLKKLVCSKRIFLSK